MIVFLIFVDWNLTKKWISSKFQSRVWSSSNQGRPLSPAGGRGSHTVLISSLKERTKASPPLPYARIPGSPSVITHDKTLRKTQTKAQSLSRPVKLRPDPTACLLALERRDKRRPTIGRSPPPAVSPRKVELRAGRTRYGGVVGAGEGEGGSCVGLKQSDVTGMMVRWSSLRRAW